MGCHDSNKLPIIIALHKKCDSPAHVMYGPSPLPAATGNKLRQKRLSHQGMPPLSMLLIAPAPLSDMAKIKSA